MLRTLAYVVAGILCASCFTARKDDLSGTYMGWMFMDGSYVASDGSLGVKDRLTLKGDGTYSYELVSTAMAQVTVTASGKFKRSGENLLLTGTMTATGTDGATSGSQSGPHTLELHLENGMLARSDATGVPFYYRKEGTGPPPVPEKLRLQPSEPDALALVEKVEKTYASLKSYSDTGTIKSGGGGFAAKDAKFTTAFERPSKFRFVATNLEGGKEFERTEITWDGKTCWWYSTEFGETTERPLGNALSISSVTYAYADFVTELLLPVEMRSSRLLEKYPEATLLPDETISGKLCAVLKLKKKDSFATTLWIDKVSNLVMRISEDLRGVTVNLSPKANPTLSTDDFRRVARKE